MIKLLLSALVSVFLFSSIDAACVNKFNGRPIVAAGDWNSISPWYINRFETIKLKYFIFVLF